MPQRTTNSNAVNVTYTETAIFGARKIVKFLSNQGVQDPKSVIDAATANFEKVVTAFPKGFGVSIELSKIGCMKYLEYNSSNGYRILYTVNQAETEVDVHVIISQRENVQQLLFERIIER
ncbi:type II toxin-antitoxin system RelE/ParE family toxin [Serratia marcescens]|jgi:hypothetical protein|uniref:type II toxin-antitoxin system RelE/ParE family toxin n=1 Tax=Serratia marcescens TaxID=615 RepID=UPI003EDA08ED